MTTTPEDLEPTSEEAYEAEKAVAAATRSQVRTEQRALLLRSPGFLVGALILGFWLLSGLFPELLDRFDPKGSVVNDLGESLRRTPPDGTAWMGTDRLGRDVYSRVVHGSRPILIAAPAATIIAAFFGTLLGLLTGYFKGWIDEIVSRHLEGPPTPYE